MNILKDRTKPQLLSVLHSLDKRADLSHEETQQLLSAEKGYQGELTFDALIKQNVNAEALVLNDLLLTFNCTTFQIDTLLISGEGVYLYEVKNYEGEFHHTTNHIRTRLGNEFVNPMNQLNRTVTLFNQMIKQWRLNLSCQSYVVFINPNFTLYNVKGEEPFILPTQIQKHLCQINKNQKPLLREHYQLAEKLIHAHQKEAAFQRKLPEYEYHMLRKGLMCEACRSYDLKLTKRSCYCTSCHQKTSLDDSVIHNVEELKTLYPKILVTSQLVYDWCDGVVPQKRIWKILKSHYIRKGSRRTSYYL